MSVELAPIELPVNDDNVDNSLVNGTTVLPQEHSENGVVDYVEIPHDLVVENKLLRNELDTVRAHNEALEDNNLDLRAQLAAKLQTEKELQEQLKVLSQFAINSGSSHQKQVDLQRMYDQMCYKDTRIVELNNIIMEKERQIMDLQEMCREQNQVAEAKNRAIQIVNKRLKELDNRKFCDASTETDSSFGFRKERFVNGRDISPGRAVPQFKLHSNNHSPPPLDPSEEQSSFVTETEAQLEDGIEGDRELTASPTLSERRRYRKRVTFDLRAASVPKRKTPQPDGQPIDQETLLDDRESLAQAVVDLSAENDQLRKTISEMEQSLQVGSEWEDGKIAALEEEAELARKDARNQAIKARAAATARIKELETKLLELRVSSSKEIDNLKASNDVLKNSREWALMENSKLLEQITNLKQKLSDLRAELDSSNTATCVIRQRLEAEERRYQNLTEELRNLHLINQQLNDDKIYLVNEVERLSEDLNQQIDVVSAMEGDLIVYEAHVSILRESLSMTKKEEQQLIKSKAFAAKLSALEQEKAVMSKRSSDEKLRTKALNAKIRELEKERDSLIESIFCTQSILQQYEESKCSGRRTMNSSLDGSESGELKKLNNTEDFNDTLPRFNERKIMQKAAQHDFKKNKKEIDRELEKQEQEVEHEEEDSFAGQEGNGIEPKSYEEMIPPFAAAEVVPIIPTEIKFRTDSAFKPPTKTQNVVEVNDKLLGNVNNSVSDDVNNKTSPETVTLSPEKVMHLIPHEVQIETLPETMDEVLENLSSEAQDEGDVENLKCEFIHEGEICNGDNIGSELDDKNVKQQQETYKEGQKPESSEGRTEEDSQQNGDNWDVEERELSDIPKKKVDNISLGEPSSERHLKDFQNEGTYEEKIEEASQQNDDNWGWGDEDSADSVEEQDNQQAQDDWERGSEQQEVKQTPKKSVKMTPEVKPASKQQQLDWAWNDGAADQLEDKDEDGGDWEDW
ncbi:unnamed protein product [Bursaphelenchus okinawaensis]|uniref:Uncharacterized protein n=1 Tax=Bursaphelenchus okinawaensis TaxID=465554 RepID=A0A811LQG4_9BILA|nr:unnamed protein product [Bursaphelenchus okinawaensis]CAG9126572.1 unnamed protein product [Bursaphelenchus okinawaensis]